MLLNLYPRFPCQRLDTSDAMENSAPHRRVMRNTCLPVPERGRASPHISTRTFIYTHAQGIIACMISYLAFSSRRILESASMSGHFRVCLCSRTVMLSGTRPGCNGNYSSAKPETVECLPGQRHVPLALSRSLYLHAQRHSKSSSMSFVNVASVSAEGHVQAPGRMITVTIARAPIWQPAIRKPPDANAPYLGSE